MKATTKRALSILVAAGLLVMALVVYVVFIRPEYELISTLRGQLSSKATVLQEETRAIEQVKNLISQYQGVAKLGDTLSLALPQEEMVASAVEQVNELSRLSGLTIQSLGIIYLPARSSSVKLSFIKRIGVLRFNLKLFGSYSGLKTFLDNLEKNIKVMDVQTLKVDQVGKAEQDLFSYSLAINTYYQSNK